jgi:hypothetical protein
MPLNCDLNALIAASAQFTEPHMGSAERKAIALYAMVIALAALGGADYSDSLTALQDAAKEWQTTAPAQREAINTVIHTQNATDNGADVPTDVNELKAASRCYLCLGDERMEQLMLFLRCAINSEGAPD